MNTCVWTLWVDSCGPIEHILQAVWFVAECYKRYFIKFSRFLAIKCLEYSMFHSWPNLIDWNLMFSTVQNIAVLLWFNKMCSCFGFFFWSCFSSSFFSLWAPKGVTYRAFAGGCYKWKFSNHSISFVTWEKWCVHDRGFLGNMWSVTGLCHCERASTMIYSHFN